MYGEDVDFSLRAAAIGCRPAITPEATVIHHVGASSAARPDRKELVLKAKVTVMTKHWPRRRALIGRFLLLVGVALRAGPGAIVGLIERRPPMLWSDLWRRRTAWLTPYEEGDGS